MLFDANIILDEEITEEDDINDWWSFADDDYVKIELVYDGRVIMSGDTTHDPILVEIDNFLKGVFFGTQEEVILSRGIKTPNNYYECKSKTFYCGEEEWWDDRLVSRKEYLEYKKNLRKKNNNEG